MSELFPRNMREINTGMIRKNMEEIRRHIPSDVKVLAVVKADGYGHGSVETARAAISGGAEYLAVATVDEGKVLRKAGIDIPILVLGAATASDAAEGAACSLVQTVCSAETAMICEKAAASIGKTAEVHVKIDTGMGRIGIRSREELHSILKQINQSNHLHITGAFTHFSDADGNEDGIRYTREQYRRFCEITEDLPGSVARHCANSAAIHRFPEMYMDMVRAGISLYGYPPVECSWDLKPCMRWTAKVSFIKEIREGEYVSYGRTFRAERPTKVATITCGYGDGYHRIAADRAQVLIRGKRFPVIGRICMDQMMADITGNDEILEGDEVVLIGRSGTEEITAEDLASWSRTISYEVLLSSASRVKRRFIDQVSNKGDELL